MRAKKFKIESKITRREKNLKSRLLENGRAVEKYMATLFYYFIPQIN